MRIFLDANVLFSGSKRQSAVHGLLVAIWERRIALVSSVLAIEEAERNLRAKYPERLSTLAEIVAGLECFVGKESPVEVDLVEKDAPILGAAIAAGCTHLATGDRRNLGHLFGSQVEGVRIVTLAMLLHDLRAAGLWEDNP